MNRITLQMLSNARLGGVDDYRGHRTIAFDWIFEMSFALCSEVCCHGLALSGKDPHLPRIRPMTAILKRIILARYEGDTAFLDIDRH